MATISRFEDVQAWQTAREVCRIVGKLIDEERFKKNFRLIDQLEGATGSVMDNIAEGFERGTRKEFIQFLGYAKGSCGEVRSQLYRALDRGYIHQEEFNNIIALVIEINNKIQKLIEYLLKTDIGGSRTNIKP